jgi:hypothetical protein
VKPATFAVVPAEGKTSITGEGPAVPAVTGGTLMLPALGAGASIGLLREPELFALSAHATKPQAIIVIKRFRTKTLQRSLAIDASAIRP